MIDKILIKLMNLRFFKRIYSLIQGGTDIELLVGRGSKIGKNCNFLDGVKIDPRFCWHIEIGDNVTLAPRVMILAHDASTKRHLGYTKLGKVKIGNNVFVGAGTIILPSVTIGDNSIIGAGSVVTKDIPANTISAGNPAKVISTLDIFITKHVDSMNISPIFGKEYTLEYNVNENMKKEMNLKIKNFGYIL